MNDKDRKPDQERKPQSDPSQRHRSGKDVPENRNSRTAEDQPFYVPERYRF